MGRDTAPSSFLLWRPIETWVVGLGEVSLLFLCLVVLMSSASKKLCKGVVCVPKQGEGHATIA